MTSPQTKEQLIEALEASVTEVLAYFEGPGRSTKARIDQWGAWEVLAHLPYWHYATAWGINSAAAAGPPWQLSGSADETNAACVKLHASEDFAEIVDQLRRAQKRLVRAARDVKDLDAPVFRMGERLVTGRQRLETIARHWQGHLQALRETEGGR